MVTTILDVLGVLLVIASIAVWVGFLIGVQWALLAAGLLVLVFSAAISRGGGRK